VAGAVALQRRRIFVRRVAEIVEWLDVEGVILDLSIGGRSVEA
jgi:hypothetical protein